MKAQRKVSVPVYFNSTTDVGLHNSMVLNLLIAAGATAVASNDSDMGSRNLQQTFNSVKGGTERFILDIP